MSYPPYNSYLSNLDSLVFDSPSEVVQTEKDVADELDLWVKKQRKKIFFFLKNQTNTKINNFF
jgi:flagellar biosynthesis chaperone FliJ